MERIKEEFRMLRLVKALAPLVEPTDIDPERLTRVQGDMNIHLLDQVGNLVSAENLRYSEPTRHVVGDAKYGLSDRSLGIVGILSYDLEREQIDPKLSTPSADIIKICEHRYAHRDEHMS